MSSLQSTLQGEAEKSLKEFVANADSLTSPADFVQMGKLHRIGLGVEKDMGKAAEWFAKAAALGDAEGLYHLGVLYSLGDGVDKDEEAAVSLFLRAEQQGHEYAKHALGLCYEFGEGVDRDMMKAAQYYEDAANSGVTEAEARYGWFLERGSLVTGMVQWGIFPLNFLSQDWELQRMKKKLFCTTSELPTMAQQTHKLI